MRIRLNTEQARAAECLDGLVLVTAGAGSGKTRMLTERFANAVVPGRLDGWEPVDPGSVVAITYTEKAAGEIADRVRAEIGGCVTERPGGRDDLWISTIHGFCARVLRRNPFEAGVDPLFTVAANLEAGRLREQAFREALATLGNSGGGVRNLLDAYKEDAVFSATLEIVRQLAVAGLNTDAIRLQPTPTIADLLAEAEALFDDGTRVCNIDYKGKSTTHLDHSELCRELLGECSEIASLDHSERGALDRVLRMAERYTAIRALSGFQDLKDEMVARKALLMAHVSAAMTAPYEIILIQLVGVYAETYARLKQVAGVLDFEDLQTKTVRLLDERPDVASRYRDRFKVVMIDEFQDTDALQLRLVERIAAKNLCTVGDEMQSIYGFRGADVAVYRRHRSAMADGGALYARLAINYRSHPQIIGFVNAVFGSEQYDKNDALRLTPNPDGRIPQLLDPILGSDPRVEILFVDTGDIGTPRAREREAAEIAGKLAELAERGMNPGDVAVLLRAYGDAHVYAEALALRGIPAVIVGGGRFFGLAETEVMRALTRVIANVADEAALGVLLVSEFIPVADDALMRLRLKEDVHRAPLWDLICSDCESLEEVDAQALRRMREVVEGARARIGREPLEDVLLRAVEEAGYDLRLLKRGNMGRDSFANVLKFARRAGEFERSNGSGPAGFSAYLDDKERLADLEAPESATDDSSGAVQIMSIHASKGLEFPVVVVADIGRGIPGNCRIVRTKRTPDELRVALKTRRLDDDPSDPVNSQAFSDFDEADKAAEEEGQERVFYVALTRARDLLLVSGTGPLNPSSRPASKNDLVKLVRVLGHDVPIGGPRDESIVIGGGGACRLRVVIPEGAEAEVVEGVDGRMDAPPPPFGEPLTDTQQRAWLPKTMSYTQLSEFQRCPRQFQIRRVLGIAPPLVGASGRPQPKRLGIALHAALQLVSREGAPPPGSRMEALARYFELSAEETLRLADATRRYCESDVAARAARAEFVIREAPLSISVGGGKFVIAGSIDLYARTGDTALIVDYKSGTSGTPEALFERYRLQAGCYAFAALRDGCSNVEVVFVRPEVALDGQMERIGYAFGTGDVELIEADLVARYGQIEESEFEPAPGSACTNCDVPLGLCEHRALAAPYSGGYASRRDAV